MHIDVFSIYVTSVMGAAARALARTSVEVCSEASPTSGKKVRQDFLVDRWFLYWDFIHVAAFIDTGKRLYALGGCNMLPGSAVHDRCR